ncbi:MAG: glycosyltransferase family 2 protein [Phycisphaeraceae bacterium]|nr:glycosyltransferase family 2 protein [Phycisphaeraceae bacterium]
MERLDNLVIPDRTEEIRCFFCGRNEALRLPEFLEYHRRLGVERFFFVDNGSTDESVDIALAEEAVHVWRTEQPYQDSRFGVDWQEALLERFGVGHWCLLLDLDEFFYYPFCDQGRRFHDFVGALDATGRTVVKSMMLDMYSDRAIAETTLRPARSIFETCPFFDRPRHLSLFFARDFRRLQRIYFQGVRARVFRNAAMIRKYPLVRYSKGMPLSLGHHHTEAPSRSLARDRTYLFHFKFLSTLRDYARESIDRGCHWDASAEYQDYLDGIERDPALILHDRRVSVRFRGTETFIEHRMIRPRGRQAAGRR